MAMTLREYLFYNDISVTDFAKKLKKSRTHISQIIHSNIPAGRKLANEIEKATGGKVIAKSLLKRPEKKKTR